ncbi:MAG: cobyric acid synthase CobQ, partial [Gordonia sp. (in: high G+C Gram-positive bacteria)]
ANPSAAARLSVAAIRLPRISNSTDVEALACEPGVDVTWVADQGSVRAADLVVLPGTRATLADLRWLRERGLDAALGERAARGAPILGICGGFQMLGRTIEDQGIEDRGVGNSGESAGSSAVPGLGLLDVDIRFESGKVLRRTGGTAAGQRITGYEIHHGRVVRSAERAWLLDDETGPEGAVRGSVRGTHWHGLLASNEFRRRLLTQIAGEAGKPEFQVAPDTDVAAIRESQLDRIADLVSEHLDIDLLVRIVERGVDQDVPSIVHRLGR